MYEYNVSPFSLAILSACNYAHLHSILRYKSTKGPHQASFSHVKSRHTNCLRSVSSAYAREQKVVRS
ncbi:hypothetical protein GCWU000325_00149 [Alloprevotella tannerae ATCC 51259]|uniref:Uncharacterized protein n=1 Tax=Alloprevotella tannerae ATCC 51259 TaxID=626522 RepID=C9LD35_9BACT|nr:hypothetical protein GCWU000325_00149 [Alloprevotella tannerae ATCC 51259]